MKVIPTTLREVVIIEPAIFDDERGSFHETWERDRYAAAGLPEVWRQDNIASSRRGALRGLHFQHPNGQHKLIEAVTGEIYDVVVDVRRGSATFGCWAGTLLSAQNRRQLSVPVGFAHGYLVLTDEATVLYKCSERYDASAEYVVRWDDPDIAVAWPLPPTALSNRDLAGVRLRDLDPSALPGAF